MCTFFSQYVAMLLMQIHHLQQWVWIAMALIPTGPSSIPTHLQHPLELLHHLDRSCSCSMQVGWKNLWKWPYIWDVLATKVCKHNCCENTIQNLVFTYELVFGYVWPCFGEPPLFVIRRTPLWYEVWGFVMDNKPFLWSVCGNLVHVP